MASIHRQKNSPYWYCAFYQPDGARAFKSTKKTNRSEAMGVCIEWEHAAKIGREGRLSEQQARKVVADIFARANSSALPTSTVREFLDNWLSRKGLELAESSLVEYEQAARLFAEYLSTKAGKPIDSITAKEITGYRAHLAGRVSGATVNKHLRIMRGAWKQALREGLIRDNVFDRIDLVRESRSRRRAFTMDELRQILGACNAEWRGLVMFGLYTGQRLGDCAGLTWDNIDAVSGELRIITGKTDRSMSIPLAEPLAAYIATMPAGDKARAPLFPGMAALVKSGGTGTLSRQFSEILAGIGLADKKDHKGGGSGRASRRASGSLSFHCLRHTATSLLKNAGVSDVVAREIIGHDSESISRVYTHISKDTLRKAMKSLPNVMDTKQATEGVAHGH